MNWCPVNPLRLTHMYAFQLYLLQLFLFLVRGYAKLGFSINTNACTYGRFMCVYGITSKRFKHIWIACKFKCTLIKAHTNTVTEVGKYIHVYMHKWMQGVRALRYCCCGWCRSWASCLPQRLPRIVVGEVLWQKCFTAVAVFIRYYTSWMYVCVCIFRYYYYDFLFCGNCGWVMNNRCEPTKLE